MASNSEGVVAVLGVDDVVVWEHELGIVGDGKKEDARRVSVGQCSPQLTVDCRKCIVMGTLQGFRHSVPEPSRKIGAVSSYRIGGGVVLRPSLESTAMEKEEGTCE